MKHAAFALLALLFWPIQGTTHGWVWSTVMLVAIYRDWRADTSAKIRRT